MRLINWSKKRLKKMTVKDYSLLKTTMTLMGIIIGAYISSFVKQYIWYFVVVTAVLYITLLYRVLKK